MADSNESKTVSVKSTPAKVTDSAQLKETAEVVEVRPGDVQPTEADYEKARTVGAGNEPELPPGVVRK